MATTVRADVETFFQETSESRSRPEMATACCPLPAARCRALILWPGAYSRRQRRAEAEMPAPTPCWSRLALAPLQFESTRLLIKKGRHLFPTWRLDAAHIPQRHDGRQVASVSRELDCQASSLARVALRKAAKREWLSRRAGQGQRRPAAFMHTGVMHACSLTEAGFRMKEASNFPPRVIFPAFTL